MDNPSHPAQGEEENPADMHEWHSRLLTLALRHLPYEQMNLFVKDLLDRIPEEFKTHPANSSGNLAAGVDWDALEKAFNAAREREFYENVFPTFQDYKSQLTDSSTIKSTAHE